MPTPKNTSLLRRLLASVLFAFLGAVMSGASEAAKKTFDLKADAAEKALKVFSAQSRVEVLFSSEAAAGVRTNAVKGDYTPMEAVELMLAGTVLYVRDASNGVVRIARSTNVPNDGRAAPATRNVLQTGSIIGQVRNAVTDQLLNKARVTLAGTHQAVFTDSFGVFQLVDVPSGHAELEVFYTGLDPIRVLVEVLPGGIARESIALTSVARYGDDARLVKLDPYVVSADKETDAQTIATNEQRFSQNIKSVLSTDSLGDVTGGSVGEFLKFIPGVTVEYDNADIASLSLRGIGGGMTAVATDGAPASGTWVTSSRSVDLRAMALNDVSRIEVTKVPTPATPADSLAGSVNLISKSAFERSGRQLIVGFNLFGNSEHLDLQKTPTSYRDREVYKILPGANVDFTWPITQNLGVVVTATHNNLISDQRFAQMTWTASGTGTALNFANPYLQSVQLNGGPRNIIRDTLSFKVDWRVTPHSVLSASHTANRSTTEIANAILTFNTGTVATPTITGGQSLTYTPDDTVGATGRGSITNNGTSQRLPLNTDTSIVTYRFDDGSWRVEAGVSRSETTMRRVYRDAGFFWQTTSTNRVPVRISYLGIGNDGVPDSIDAYNNTNQIVNWRNIDNYRSSIAIDGTADNLSRVANSYINVRRRLDVFSVPTAVQAGVAVREQVQDRHVYQERWSFNGPDGATADASLRPYVNQAYKGPIYDGYDDLEWMSPSRAWEAYQQNSRLFGPAALAQQVAVLRANIDNSEYFKETVAAGYVQMEASLLSQRMKLLGGVRYERTRNVGLGVLNDADAVWRRDAGGNYIRNAEGNRVRKAEAGAVNSLEEVLITRTERGSRLQRTYDGYYPSFHVTYDLTDNFLIRAAYAKTYGRPDITEIIPRTVVTNADLDEEDPTPVGGRGTITLRNPSLKPWSADNFDLSFEYYSSKGGMMSLGVFHKELQNFFGSASRIATASDLEELGLDSQYLDWLVTTTFNSGDARIQGAEINIRLPLRQFAQWAAPFTVFANGTKLWLEGNPGANFTSFIPESGNAGVSFSHKRFSVTARVNYRGLDKRLAQPAYGADGYEYIEARSTFDMNATVQLSRRYKLTFSALNLTDAPLVTLRYGSATPGYARTYWIKTFGTQLSVGIRGTF